jgi:hypothetical protein
LKAQHYEQNKTIFGCFYFLYFAAGDIMFY